MLKVKSPISGHPLSLSCYLERDSCGDLVVIVAGDVVVVMTI